MHVLGFAEELARRGHGVMISLAGDPGSAEREGLKLPTAVEVHQHRFTGPALSRATLSRARAFSPDVVHAWTPRVPSVPAARAYTRATGAPYVVHFDDDEWRPWPHAGRDLRTRVGRVRRRAMWRLHPPLWGTATSRSLRWAAREAVGLDALTPRLAEEVESRLGRPCSVLYPILPGRTEPGDGASVIQRHGDERIVLFTGRVIPTALPDFLCAIRAVANLRRRGMDVRLVQTGAVTVDLDLAERAREEGLDGDALSLLGHVRFVDVLPTLRAADVLIQPGPPSRFNQLRLPSKLMFYLESGTPVVTFSVGFGELLRDGQEALLTQTDDPAELADRLASVFVDDRLRARLAEGGPRAANRLFNPTRNTDALVAYYHRSLGIEPKPTQRTEVAQRR